MKIHHDVIHLKTSDCLQFLDVTEAVTSVIRKYGVTDGILNVQTKHTTAAVMVNENEPLLLEDMKSILERLAPQDNEYQHNDFRVRTVNLEPQEAPNGHSHCKALFLPTSQTLNISEGQLQLGRWQRIFLIELDGARERTLSLMIMGIDREP